VISLTGLTLPHFYACPKPGAGFPMPYVLVFFFGCKWHEVIGNCLFVDIGGITV